MQSKPNRRFVMMGLAAGAASLLAGCKIVPIAKEERIEGQGFDAKAWADDLWADKALPYFTSSAKPLPEVLAAIAADLDAAGKKYGYRPGPVGSPWSFVVTGTGTVKAKNTKSRAGTLVVALDGSDPPADVTIQIGPVVRGNSIRDSLPFVSFGDFTNQIEFADAGKALAALALAGVTADADAIEKGEKVTFTGTMDIRGKSDEIRITPISLKAAG